MGSENLSLNPSNRNPVMQYQTSDARFHTNESQ